jgi:hypothetical protein
MTYDAFNEYERSMWEPRAGSFADSYESLTDGDVVALSIAAAVASATAP